MGNFGRAAPGAAGGFARHGAASSAIPNSVPMDINHVGWESKEESEESQESSSTSTASGDPMAIVLAKLESMELRLNALAQGSAGAPSAKKSFNGNKVSGLKSGDIDRLRAENRCFRCKKKGHFKRECDSSF
jgi:hypothetical protein